MNSSANTDNRLCALALCVLAFTIVPVSRAISNEDHGLPVWSLESKKALCDYSGKPDDAALNHHNAARAHLELGRRYLKEASDQSSTEKLQTAHTEFEQAAQEFRSYMAQAVPPKDRLYQLWSTTSGLLESGYPLEALELIFQHPEAHQDSTVLHLTADALFDLGAREAAAHAYEKWVAEGKCSGYYRSWYGEVNMTGEHLPFLVSAHTPKNPCNFLPPELRTRLESLNQVFQHPSNLPKRNYPSAP
jgi:tetratricopeptide (TPR) repeat protein